MKREFSDLRAALASWMPRRGTGAAGHVVRSPDFIEGVRAALVDKGRSPQWATSQYEDISSDGEIVWTREGTGPVR